MVTLNESMEERIKDEIVVALLIVDRSVLTSVENLVNSGNKFRANLFYNTRRCFGYDNEEDLITISASLEILHRASLMHDDLADKSSTRRGVNTLHNLYGDIFAIYIPNLLRDHAEQMLAEYLLIQEELTRVYNEICKGQLLEISLSKLNHSNWEDYEKIVEFKSSGLGRFALNSAYYLAHNQIDEENPKQIAKTGALLFQVVDDLEDLLEVRYLLSTVSTDVQNGVKPALWFFLSSEDQSRLRLPDEIQKALTRPDILHKTYQKAEDYLTRLFSQFKEWLPDNDYRKIILDSVNERYNERIAKYRRWLR